MEYKRVNTDFWEKIKFRCCSPEAKLVALYLLTSTHRRSEGLFRIPDFYIAGDLDFPLKVVQQSLNELEKTGFLASDPANNLVFIKKLLKHKLSQKQQLTALNRLNNLPDSPLFKKLLKAARHYKPDFAELLVKKLNKKLAPLKKKKSNLKQNKKAASSDSPALIENKVAKIKAKNDPLTAEALRLSRKLLKLIQQNNPRTVLPAPVPADSNFRLWIKSLKDLKLLGPPGAKAEDNKGYSWLEIERLIELSQKHSFWKNIILDAEALRKNIIKIENQLKSKEQQKSSKMDMLASLYFEAAEEDRQCKKRK